MQATTMTKATALPLDFGTPGADPQHLRSVPLDAVHMETDFPVRRLDAEALDALAKSLEIVGQLQPIGVRAAGANWSLVYGERRLRAARLLGWRALLARVYSPIGAVPVVLRATENMHRQEYSLEDAAETVLRLVEAGMSPPSIAKALARSESWVSSVLGIARNPLARELVELGRIQSASAWEVFAALSVAAQRAVVESSDPITVARCETARRAADKQQGRQQQSLMPAPTTRQQQGNAARIEHEAEHCRAAEDEAPHHDEYEPEDTVTLRIGAARRQAIQRVCQQEGRTVNDVLTEALDAWIASHGLGVHHG